MYCKNCNVSVKSDYPICPLCHQNLESSCIEECSYVNKEEKIGTLEYPNHNNRKKLISNFPTTSIFLLTVLPLFIIALIVDIVLFTSPTWSLILGATLLIAYITIRNTFLSDCGYGMRIAYQLFGFVLLFYAIQSFFPTEEFASSIALPALISIALVVNSIFLAIKHGYHGSLFVSSTLFSMLSFLPLILAVSGVMYTSVTVIVTAVLGGIGLISTVIFSKGKLLTYFKMTFNN